MRKHRGESLSAGGSAALRTARWAPGAGDPAAHGSDPAALAAAGAGVGAPVSPALGRVAGYRLVRVLGEGRSSIVYLGYADTGRDAAGAAVIRRAETVDEAEPRRTAAIKLYRAGIPVARIDAEVAALAAVDHAHLQRLVDIATTDDGTPCLLLERCDTGGLAQLVADRPSLSPGEAVTILAPVVAAVGALHGAGYVHRGIRLSAVLFAPSGAPVLCEFGSAETITTTPTPAGLASDPAVLDDRGRLLSVVRAVLERLDEPLESPVDEWLARHPATADDFVPRLTDALFDLAEPQPVRLHDRVGRPAAVAVRPHPRPEAVVNPPRTPSSRWLGDTARALLRHARGVRRRYWMITAGVAVSLVIALVAVPEGARQQARSSPSDGTRVSTESPKAPEHDAQQPDAQQTDAPQAEVDPPTGEAVIGDDPVAAVVALLTERQRCVRDLSVLCLDAVLQQGSAALERDVAVIRRMQAGAELTADATVETSGPVLIERLGDSALLDLGDVPKTQPASALIMRGEAGWRIRDYLGE